PATFLPISCSRLPSLTSSLPSAERPSRLVASAWPSHAFSSTCAFPLSDWKALRASVSISLALLVALACASLNCSCTFAPNSLICSDIMASCSLPNASRQRAATVTRRVALSSGRSANSLDRARRSWPGVVAACTLDGRHGRGNLDCGSCRDGPAFPPTLASGRPAAGRAGPRADRQPPLHQPRAVLAGLQRPRPGGGLRSRRLTPGTAEIPRHPQLEPGR